MNDNLTGYHAKIIDLCADITEHGFGKVEISFYSLNDHRIKIIISAGKQYAYFIDKEIKFDKEGLL